MNSSTTPIEEDSQYFISLTAMNSVGRSAPAHTTTSTSQASKYNYHSLLYMIFNSYSAGMQFNMVNCACMYNDSCIRIYYVVHH